jgi:anti-sigma factor RsiW
VTHLDADRLADLDEGLLSAADTGEAQSHLEACPDCTRLHADLLAVQELLAQAPAPVIPDSLVARLETAIAAESSRRSEPGNVRSLHNARSRRLSWLPKALVAAAGVTVFALVGQSVLDGSGTGSGSASDSTTAEGRAAGRGATPSAARDTPAPRTIKRILADKVIELDSATFRQSLRAEITPDKVQASSAPGSEVAPVTQTAQQCVRTVLGAHVSQRSYSAPARLDGRPVTLVLATSAGGLRAWAVSCLDNPHLVASAHIPTG